MKIARGVVGEADRCRSRSARTARCVGDAGYQVATVVAKRLDAPRASLIVLIVFVRVISPDRRRADGLFGRMLRL